MLVPLGRPSGLGSIPEFIVPHSDRLISQLFHTLINIIGIKHKYIICNGGIHAGDTFGGGIKMRKLSPFRHDGRVFYGRTVSEELISANVNCGTAEAAEQTGVAVQNTVNKCYPNLVAQINAARKAGIVCTADPGDLTVQCKIAADPVNAGSVVRIIQVYAVLGKAVPAVGVKNRIGIAFKRKGLGALFAYDLMQTLDGIVQVARRVIGRDNIYAAAPGGGDNILQFVDRQKAGIRMNGAERPGGT